MGAALPGIDEPVDVLIEKYGAFEISSYRTDIYPPSYVFKHNGVQIKVKSFGKIVKKVDVFFAVMPLEPIGVLLERYSGVSGWRDVPLGDPAFAKHFPIFSTKDSGNLFLVAATVFALVQRDVGLGELVLWIQANDYPELLAFYRSQNRK